MNVKREGYYIAVADGATVEKNQVTICSIPSLVNLTRFQVYSNRKGENFFKMYKDIELALDDFMRLSS